MDDPAARSLKRAYIWVLVTLFVPVVLVMTPAALIDTYFGRGASGWLHRWLFPIQYFCILVGGYKIVVAKGLSRLWTLLGFFHCFGILFLAILSNKRANKAQVRSLDPCLQQGPPSTRNQGREEDGDVFDKNDEGKQMTSTATCKGCGKNYETSFFGWQNADFCKACFNKEDAATADDSDAMIHAQEFNVARMLATATGAAAKMGKWVGVISVGIVCWGLIFAPKPVGQNEEGQWVLFLFVNGLGFGWYIGLSIYMEKVILSEAIPSSRKWIEAGKCFIVGTVFGALYFQITDLIGCMPLGLSAKKHLLSEPYQDALIGTIAIGLVFGVFASVIACLVSSSRAANVLPKRK